jgi:membrane-associated phospholipid phosphatase
MAVCVLSLVFGVTQQLKVVFTRERPTAIPGIYRICNMRAREHGKSMPSGDAACCAFMATWMYLLFRNPFGALIILPLNMAGRVYVHCHWFGDTIVGAMIGSVFAFITVSNFRYLASPFFFCVMQAW